jgi:PBP1b-binding outer membrane lipoprotein LpoB
MKKTTTLLLATFAALTLGGCGGESSPAMTVDEAAVTAAQQISYSDQAVTGVTGDFPLITESEAQRLQVHGHLYRRNACDLSRRLHLPLHR